MAEPDRLSYERAAWAHGYRAVTGVDEAGRGALVGAVVAAAVVWRQGVRIAGVRDSKQLTPEARERVYRRIVDTLPVGVGVVGPRAIEAINIKQAARLAMRRAVLALSERPDWLLVDAERVPLDLPQEAIVRGDDLSRAIGAASIVAKVTRDRMCTHWHRRHPEYGIDRHKGYATAEHVAAIRRFGPSPLHRATFLGRILGAPAGGKGAAGDAG